MKKIKPLHDFVMPGQAFTKEQVVEVHDDTAELCVGRGHAELIADAAPEQQPPTDAAAPEQQPPTDAAAQQQQPADTADEPPPQPPPAADETATTASTTAH